ncbi:hypothetical protein VP1G_10121 [Cytospora mali]|uniref:Alternative oxidase n=1 Tax=Cytospora mali TaxID=578113 RepID=A0A194VGK3_CYTMA|nr:hypothetical protein VP1G_10121 [Valsa mali var. pyri (nom. inval.)]
MLDSSRLFRILKYLVLILLIFFAIPFLNRPSTRERYTELLRNFKDEKRLFIADFLDNEIDGTFDGRELAKLCAGKRWRPEDEGLILSCQPVPGGIGEVKNSHLQCIRFAIEIGAQLVLPRITRRSPADISNLNGEKQAKGQPLDYMFSSPHLVTSLHTHCPQMKIHTSLDDLYDKPSLLKPLPVIPAMLTDQFSNVDNAFFPVITDPAQVRAKFDTLYDRELPRDRRRYPVRVELEATPFVVLAASGLYNLAKRFGLPVDPRRGLSGSYGGDAGADNKSRAMFVGVHLRTEKDVVYRDLGFPDYDAQVMYFFNYLEKAMEDGRHRVVYLATGLGPGDDDVRRFRARAAELNATVVTKRDVLGPGEVGVLNNRLTWDQRALVDYEIMLRVGLVLGVAESSFAWGLAMRRGNAYGGGGSGGGVDGADSEHSGYLGLPEQKPWDVFDPEDVVMWKDRYSTLYGRTGRGVTMFNGIWP